MSRCSRCAWRDLNENIYEYFRSPFPNPVTSLLLATLLVYIFHHPPHWWHILFGLTVSRTVLDLCCKILILSYVSRRFYCNLVTLATYGVRSSADGWEIPSTTYRRRHCSPNRPSSELTSARRHRLPPGPYVPAWPAASLGPNVNVGTPVI